MFRRAGLQIAYVFLPDLGEEVYGFFTDFLRGEREQASCPGTNPEEIRLLTGRDPQKIRKKSVSCPGTNPEEI